MNLFFLIRSLGNGGAERQLTELVRCLDTSRFQVTVATFYDGGALRPDIEGLRGVRVVSLAKKGRWDILPFLWRLARVLRETRPAVIHGYMGIANELSLLFGRAFGARVVWGLRMSRVDHAGQGWMTVASFRIAAALSRFADLMIANSHSGRLHYIEENYRPERLVVVSNGIDTTRFRPDAEAGGRIRAEWGFKDEPLIGLVGRLNPQKDHPNFLRAAAILAERRPDARFVCVGDGPAAYRECLERQAGGRVLWVRACRDMTGVHNALDVSTLCSAYGEGFPNVVGEAMACGAPVVATDVGDSAMILGNPSQVVPPGDPEALAAAWERILALAADEKAALGRAERERIVRDFSVEKLARNTVSLLENLK